MRRPGTGPHQEPDSPLTVLHALNTNTLTRTEEKNIGSQEAFDAHLASLKDFPQWWLDLKKENWKRFQELPAPHRKDENWRFASLGGLDLDPYRFDDGAPDQSAAGNFIERSNQVRQRAGRLVFANDRLVDHEKISAELAEKGVVWMPIEQAVREHEELLRRHFMAQPIKLGSEKFSALHGAFCSAGSFLHVPKGVEIELPLVACHWTASDGAALFPHTLLIADEQSKVTLVDFFATHAASGRNYICGVNDLYAGPGARVTYVSAQDWGRQSLAFHLNSTQAFKDAFITSLNVNTGGRQARTESHSQVMGEGAHTEMQSLTVATGKQEFDQRTLQTHFKGHSVSDLLYKNALFDDARTIFSGLIKVEEDAQQTDAYQTNRNLLLSTTAEANALPGLEILANDVKCSHGATSGQIDDDQIYYLKARGIPDRVAKELLVFGFFEDVLGKLHNEEIAENLRASIREHVSRI